MKWFTQLWQEVQEAFRTARLELDAEKAAGHNPSADNSRLKYSVPCQPLSGALAVQFAGRFVVWIDYIDAEEIGSRRRVVVSHSTDNYLHGFCLEACGERQFGYFRMKALVDLATGEIIEQTRAAVETHLKKRPRAAAQKVTPAPTHPIRPSSAPPNLRPALAALEPHLPEARTLVYVARRDGAMRQAERTLIVRYLKIVSQACSAIDDSALEAEVRRLDGLETWDIRKDLANLSVRSEKWRNAFAQLCVKIAQSDNRLHDAERNALADIHRRLGVAVPAAYVGNRRPGQAQ